VWGRGRVQTLGEDEGKRNIQVGDGGETSKGEIELKVVIIPRDDTVFEGNMRLERG
jgi:hypothetical protein